MKISGFTFVKNATKLYIPAKEAILSVLPLVDEFVIAIDKGDADDTTEADILSIQSDKIKLIHTEWQSEKYPKNTIFAQQTDVAKNACTGDWLFYIQCDEAIHENYYSEIRKALNEYHNDPKVEGLLFDYKHFWGDFEHYNPSHTFYSKEIRIIRNLPQIHSWKDAQSFRFHFNDFEPSFESYQRKEGTRKLNVAKIQAEIYHYGWVRPPQMMNKKRKTASITYHGKEATQKRFEKEEDSFDYGPLQKTKTFKDTHPKVMENWINKIYWKDQLQYTGVRRKKENPPKHEKLKYRILTWIESKLLGGKRLGEFENYKRIR